MPEVFGRGNDSFLGFCAGAVQPSEGSQCSGSGSTLSGSGKGGSAKEHRPDYLRKAQAERELEEAKRQGKVKELAAGHSVGTGESDMASGGLKTGERMEGQKAGTGAEAGKGNAPEEENR